MYFTDAARRLMGMVSVEVIERPRSYPQIKISGIRGDLLSRDLQYYYNTSRVAKYMFDKLSTNSVLFPAFFALEVLEIMDKIVKTPRSNYLSRNTAKKVYDALLEGTALKRTLEEDYPERLNLRQLSKFTLQPLPHQAAWLQRFDEITYKFGLNGAIFDGVMGSGKTIGGLYLSECCEADVTFIVTPKNALQTVWIDTIENKMTYKPTIWRSDRPTPYKNERYVIVHYEALGEALNIARDIARKNKKVCIVIDESHNFNEIKTGRTLQVIELCRITQSEFIDLQSGTPFKAIGAEIIPALFMIDPTFNDEMSERFKKLYAASATEALELLKRRLGMITHKVVKEELGLQPPIIQNVPVKSSNGSLYTLESVAQEMGQFIKERTEYYRTRKAEDERQFLQYLDNYTKTSSFDPRDHAQYLSDLKVIRRGDLRMAKDEVMRANTYENKYILPTLSSQDAKQFKELKTIYKYVILKIQGECLGRVLGRRRMECSVEIARSLDYDRYIQSTEKKTLIYTIYVSALEAARDTVTEKGYKTLTVFGDTNRHINSIIEDFNRNKDYNPLVATFHSLSTAVPLTAADVLVCIDTPFRSHILQQAIARISRLGATTQTYVYIAVLDTDNAPNLSTRTIDILKWSQTQIEKITGVAPPFEVTDANVSIEGYAMAGETLKDEHFVELDLEDAFMAKLV